MLKLERSYITRFLMLPAILLALTVAGMAQTQAVRYPEEALASSNG